MRTITRREVPQPEFEKFIKEYPGGLTFDGLRYTTPVKMRGIIWKKPVAIKENGKFILLEDM